MKDSDTYETDLSLLTWSMHQMRRAARTIELLTISADSKSSLVYAAGLDMCADAVELRLAASAQRLYRFSPIWRTKPGIEEAFGGLTVEVAAHPTAEWISKLHDFVEGSPSMRFSLMANGELYFGDAWSVVHRDMQQIRDPDEAAPILIGVVARKPETYKDDNWRVIIVQYFMSGKNNMKMARRLLEQLSAWAEFVNALGQDPFTMATEDFNNSGDY